MRTLWSFIQPSIGTGSIGVVARAARCACIPLDIDAPASSVLILLYTCSHTPIYKVVQHRRGGTRGEIRLHLASSYYCICSSMRTLEGSIGVVARAARCACILLDI